MSKITYPDTLPKEFKPLGAWKYFGYSLLFSLPLAGFVLAIVFAVDNDNIHRRNFARATLIIWGISIVISILIFLFSITVTTRLLV